MKYDEAKKAWGAGTQLQFDESLRLASTDGTAKQHQLADNFKIERHVEQKLWDLLADEIVRYRQMTTAPTADGVCGAIMSCCAGLLQPDPLPGEIVPNKIPTGPQFGAVLPARFGRVVGRRRLLSLAMLYCQTTAPDELSLQNLFDDLSQPRGFAVHFAAVGGLPIGAHLIWSTFNESNRMGDPFPTPHVSIANLIRRLGLDADMLGVNRNGVPDRLNDACVLLRYELPAGRVPHVPTIIEAYAGGMNYYFRVSDFDPTLSELPRTLPTPEVGDEKGLPEVVHCVVMGAQLVEPLQFTFLH